MNDPGLDEPIADHAEGVENEKRDEKDAAEEDEQAFLEPALWWFASTAFPLAAGTFGPMASAFSICALAVHWREEIPPGKAEADGVDLPDPKWLIAINAVQLVIALISNLFLLLNMAKRVRFSVAQPVTIVGWYISSFALVALTSCVRGPLAIEPKENHAFSQAFYYAIFAAGLYFIVASLMLVTVYGAYKGHYDKDFQLTMSQRTLMLQTISFLVYLLSGAAVFARVEGWKFQDAVYFADFTLLTVGIGDITPTTHTGRSLLFPYAIGGIIILGLVIGSIRSLVLDRGKVKMGARMVEKERRRLLKKLQKKEKDEILNPIKDEKRPSLSRNSTRTVDNHPELLTERQRRHQEFKLMRKIQASAQKKRRWTSLVISGTIWMALWFVGAAIFQQSEKSQGWSYFVSMYFAYTSLLTIGYGDYYPTSNSGKAFFVFWSLLAIPSLTILISNMGDTIIKGIRDLTLWIGNFTVLPGEKGVRLNLMETAHKLTRGKWFHSKIQEMPPGILGESKRRSSASSSQHEGTGGGHIKDDPESAAQRINSDLALIEEKNAHERGRKNDPLPRSKHHYHLLLIREISSVMRHIRSTPPRKYTFEEWAWYLKLAGENEDDADHHRRAAGGKLTEERLENAGGVEGEGMGGAGGGQEAGEKKSKWSWVGKRSPLMGNKEEAEWVLERLTKRLEGELEWISKEEARKSSHGSGSGEGSGGIKRRRSKFKEDLER